MKVYLVYSSWDDFKTEENSFVENVFRNKEDALEYMHTIAFEHYSDEVKNKDEDTDINISESKEKSALIYSNSEDETLKMVVLYFVQEWEVK